MREDMAKRIKKWSESVPAPSPVSKKTRGTKPSTSPSGKGTPIRVAERPPDFKGIEQLVFVDAATLTDHPDNWKTHTRRQLSALDAEFDTVGWVLPLAYNLTTNRLLDGHGRKKTDWVKRHRIVPVVIGRWSPEEEDQILLHLDPIGGMFETTGSKFRALMDRHKAQSQELIDSMTAAHREAMEHVDETLEIHNEAVDYGAPASFLPDFSVYDESKSANHLGTDSRKDIIDIEESSSALPGMYDLKLFSELPFDCFGQGALYNIPVLREDMLSDVPSPMQNWVGPETPEAESYFYIYGCAAIEKVRSNKLVVAWYTYDHKFESIWSDPRKFTARMINFDILAAITPNFSIWENCPLWFEIYQTARSRWLGRYWQDTNKIRIVPDIQLSNLRDDERFKLRMTGLPRDLPAISIQVQQKGDADPEGYYAMRRVALLRVLKHLCPRQIILYHGPDLPKNWTSGIDPGIEIIPVKSWMWERGKVLREKEYLNQE